MRCKAVFERRKKEAASRLVYYSHHAPPVKSGEFVQDVIDGYKGRAREDPRLTDCKVGPLLPAEVSMTSPADD